ncbi:MAG: hypothetical protein AAF170_08475 [Bacteroidota bacterium]
MAAPSSPSPARDEQGRRHRRQADPERRTHPGSIDNGPLFHQPAYKGGSPDAQFLTFHEANPHVYRELVKMARQLKAQGHRSYSIKGLYEALRFKWSLRTHGDVVKLNNNNTSRYARLIMAQEPDLKGFFQTREMPSREGGDA